MVNLTQMQPRATNSQQMTPKENNLLCEKDVARILNVHVATVRRARADGNGPPFLKIRGSIRYRQRDVTDFIAEKMVTA